MARLPRFALPGQPQHAIQQTTTGRRFSAPGRLLGEIQPSRDGKIQDQSTAPADVRFTVLTQSTDDPGRKTGERTADAGGKVSAIRV